MDNIQITEKDFSTLNDALNKLAMPPDPVNAMVTEIMGNMIAGDNAAKRELMQREQRRYNEERKREHNIMADDIRILQAKLIELKRALIAKANVAETDSILNYVK